MSFVMDPQISAVMPPMPDAMSSQEHARVGDIAGRRAWFLMVMRAAEAAKPAATDVKFTDFSIARGNGVTICLRWYRKTGSAPGSAALYVHGGGMIMGDVAQCHNTVASYVSASNVPMLSVGYRVAPEHVHPSPAEDVYAALVWLAEQAAELGVDRNRLAVMGNSAGGGIAALVALMARDRGGPHVARQLLIHPMLDDRTVVPDPEIVPFATWGYDDNRTAWQALLGDAAGGAVVPDYAVPARMDVAGLPPTYIEVGELDIFRDEAIVYGRRIARAGTSIELHVRPGCPHVFDQIAPRSDVAVRAQRDRERVLQLL